MVAELPAGWADDFDLFDPRYLEDPFAIWKIMREECPVAQSSQRGGAVLPARHSDISAIARDPATFSSRVLEATGRIPREGNELKMPPVNSDPPNHAHERRILLPLFNRTAIDKLEPGTRERTAGLAEALVGRESVDAAEEFAQHVPIGVIVEMLGVPAEDLTRFSGWVAQLLKEGPTDQVVREQAIASITQYFLPFVRGEETAEPDGVIAELRRRQDAENLSEQTIIGMCFLLLIAGIDTTWSAIGSSLWHLATHPEDRRRLVEDASLIPVAVEEFIRAYAPITIGRVTTTATSVGGCPVSPGDRVLLPWGAANRDPEAFEDPDEVLIDRQKNPHLAFGLGIHRCLGSGMARMEVKVALEEWLKRFPEFTLDPTAHVEWTGGNVRGPGHLPLSLGQ